MAERYGDSFSGIGRDSQGHLYTKTTLTYGPTGEAGLANLRKGAEIRGQRAKASAIRTRTYYGNNRAGDALPVDNLSRPYGSGPRR